MASPSDNVTPMPAPPDRLAAWMAEYGPALKRYFVKKTGAAYAEDLVQEVFLRLQASAGRAPSDNVARYLFAIARSVLIDRIRADATRQSKFHDDIDDADGLADEISPERILAGKQDYARAMTAIAAMPPRMRTAFLLHRFGKMSYAAIAKRMGVSKGTVQDFMERALERILQEMEERP